MQFTHRQSKAPLAIAATLALFWASTGAAAPLLPPDLDYAKHCAPVVAAPQAALDRDWTTWNGEPVALPPEQLLEIANEYLRGSERVEKNAETGLRLLAYLEELRPGDRPRYDRLIGRALIDNGSTEQLEEGEARLQRALAAGETRAAFDLAQLYGPTGPSAMRSAEKARALAQTSAASGNADGKLLFAGILAADPTASPEQKQFAVDEAIVSMIGAIAAGDCGYLTTVGTLYLQGRLVPEDVPTAIAWFRQAAETGDARVEERLGNLIAGPRIDENDFELALRYSQSAADKGRIGAAVTVGQAYATGLIRPRDLDQARHYLGLASAAGSRDASLWLARIAHGDFGGERDLEAARRFYRAAIEQGPPDQELATEFGFFLVEAVSDPADLAEAKTLLTDAALAGSGRAAVKVAELLLTKARKDPAQYDEVRTWLHLGAEFGRPEAARHLATLSLCAGPMYDPAEALRWRERAIGLGAESLALTDGLKRIASVDRATREAGVALIRKAALQGDARAVGYALAALADPAGMLGGDTELANRLKTFVDRSTDPAYVRAVALSRLGFTLEGSDAPEVVDPAMAELEGYIAEGDLDATLLKASVLKDRDAPLAEQLPLYQAAADRSIVKGMRELGFAMLEDPESDPETARTWLQKAADLGDLKSALRLVDTSANTAMTALAAIGESGTVCSVDGMISMARTYAEAADPAAPAEAARWLSTAADLSTDSAEDLVRIASAYADGIGGPDAVGKAEPLLAKAMQMGSTEAVVMLADGHIDGTWPDADPDTAQQLLAGLAAEGNAEAAAELLRAVSKGLIGMPAADVMKLAEAAGPRLADNGSTLLKLARLDEEGAFGNPDPERQFQWLQAAAEAGDAAAMMRLYRSYASGIGVVASPDEAFAWLQKAADIGDPRAVKEIAAAYTVGFGTPADPERAAYWRARAQVN